MYIHTPLAAYLNLTHISQFMEIFPSFLPYTVTNLAVLVEP